MDKKWVMIFMETKIKEKVIKQLESLDEGEAIYLIKEIKERKRKIKNTVIDALSRLEKHEALLVIEQIKGLIETDKSGLRNL